MAQIACTECGTANAPERRFCSSCGSLLEASGAAPAVASGGAAGPRDWAEARATPDPSAEVRPEADTQPARIAPDVPWAPSKGPAPEILTVEPPRDALVRLIQAPTDPGAWTCPQCSHVNGSSRLFCASCGYARGQTTPSVVRLPTQPLAATPVVVPRGFSVSPTIILAGIAAIVLLAAGGILVGGMLGHPGQSPVASQPGGAGGGGRSSDVPNGVSVDIGDYTGQTPIEVKAALGALCTPSPCLNVRWVPVASTDVEFRHVVGTDPAAGQAVAAGDTIDVLVSVADKPTDGMWFETTETDHTFSCIANRHGYTYKPLETLNPGIDDFDHFPPGELIWIPGDPRPPIPPTGACE